MKKDHVNLVKFYLYIFKYDSANETFMFRKKHVKHPNIYVHV
jgi:hypothetical protein